MAKKGRMTYVPKIVLEEIDTIKRNENIEIGSEAFRKLVGYARIGKEFQIKKNLSPEDINFLSITRFRRRK
jgi:hypothetical protein